MSVSSGNQIISQTDFKPFFMAIAQGDPARFSEAPMQIASETNWYFAEADPGVDHKNDWGMISSQSTLGANGTLMGTSYANYFDGKPGTITDSAGDTTTNVYDSHGNLISTTTNSGTSLALTTYFSYTDGTHGVPAGLPVETWKIRDGVHTTLSYNYYYGTSLDSNHRYIVGPTSGYSDTAGELAGSENSSGVIHWFDYNAQGETVRDRFFWTNPTPSDGLPNQWVTTTTAYDSGGRESSSTDSLGNTTSTHYNALGQSHNALGQVREGVFTRQTCARWGKPLAFGPRMGYDAI